MPIVDVIPCGWRRTTERNVWEVIAGQITVGKFYMYVQFSISKATRIGIVSDTHLAVSRNPADSSQVPVACEERTEIQKLLMSVGARSILSDRQSPHVLAPSLDGLHVPVSPQRSTLIGDMKLSRFTIHPILECFNN